MKHKQAHRWIQMTLNESKELESIDHVPTKCDYNAVDDDGTDMIKYHVNFSYTGFQETLSMFRYGGNLSIQKPIGSKVVMYVGQDLSNFYFQIRCGSVQVANVHFYRRTKDLVQWFPHLFCKSIVSCERYVI